MKYNLFILLIAVFASLSQQINAQISADGRLVLVEHFTQASSMSCANYDAMMDNVMESNTDKVVAINYHTFWPGFDPMYNDNPEDVNTRVAFYEVEDVPTTVLNGYVNESVTTSSIETTATINVPFTIEITAELFNIIGSDSSNFPEATTASEIEITATITASEKVSGNLRAFAVVLEENICYLEAPGSNGATNFKNIMKKMLPDAAGQGLSNFNAGSVATINEWWPLENVYDANELAVVVFVQDMTSKEIFQAAYARPTTATSPYTLNVNLREIFLAKNDCETGVLPKIAIQNLGSEPINSLTIEYRLNEAVEPSILEWTGELATLEQTFVELPLQSSVINGEVNFLSVDLLEPNNEYDEDLTNNFESIVFQPTGEVEGNTVFLHLFTDNFGVETSWQVTNSVGDLVYAGNDYGNFQTVEETFIFTASDCYTFHLLDTYGDGICCDLGEGFYTLMDEAGNVLASGGTFEFEERTTLKVNCTQPTANALTTNAYGTSNNGSIFVETNNLENVLLSIDNGISWQESTTFSDLAAGSYTILVQNTQGCITSINLSIESVCNEFEVLMFIEPTIENEANGSVSININGQDEPYTYQWTNGETDMVVSNLNAGTYFVTVTDAYGCSQILSATIENISLVGIDINNLSSEEEITLIKTYPNPAQNKLMVALDAAVLNAELSLYNALGEKVQQTKVIDTAFTMDVTDLPSGVYYLSLQLGTTNLVSDKIIIAK